MSTKVILPNFTLPGDGPHPAVRALWVSGGLLVIATVILGAAVWHKQSVNAAVVAATAKATAELAQPASAEVARQAAPAQQALAAAAPSAVVEAAAPVAAEAPAAEASAPTGRHKHHRHHVRAVRASSHGKAVAVRAAGDGKASRKSTPRNDDAIDRLLKQFK